MKWYTRYSNIDIWFRLLFIIFICNENKKCVMHVHFLLVSTNWKMEYEIGFSIFEF